MAASAKKLDTDASPSSEERSNIFAKWMESNGATMHADLDFFSPLPGGGRGVVALRPIPRGETLLAVPKTACMYVPITTSTEDDAGPSSASNAATAMPAALRTILALDPRPSNFMATVLLLMAEHALGPSSAYSAYLATLPATHDALTAWSPAELQLLQGTSLEYRGGNTAADIFAREVAPLVKAHPDTWPPAQCDETAFVWALGMVQSRAFHMADGSGANLEASKPSEEPSHKLYMIPGVDALNHSSDAAVRSTELKAVGDDAQGAFIMVAERDIAAGEEVVHSYGALSDAQTLQTFGFVEFREDSSSGWVNPNNTVHVASELVAEAAQAVAGLSEAELEERIDTLRATGLLAAAREVPAAEPLNDALLAVAQVLVMPREAFDAWSDAGGGAGVLGAAVLGEHPELGADACMSLLRAVQMALKRLPDENTLKEAATWRQRCAAHLREGQCRGLTLLKRQLGEALCALDDGDSDESDEEDEESSGSEEESEEEEAAAQQKRNKRARRG